MLGSEPGLVVAGTVNEKEMVPWLWPGTPDKVALMAPVAGSAV